MCALVHTLSHKMPQNCTSCCAGLENLCLSDIDTGSGAFFGILFEIALLAYSFVAVAIIAAACYRLGLLCDSVLPASVAAAASAVE